MSTIHFDHKRRNKHGIRGLLRKVSYETNCQEWHNQGNAQWPADGPGPLPCMQDQSDNLLAKQEDGIGFRPKERQDFQTDTPNAV